jgi:hypothetical protein
MMKFGTFLQNFVKQYEIESKIFRKSLKNTNFFLNFSKNGQILDFGGSEFLDHRFSFVKKQFFLSFSHPGLIYWEKPTIQQFPGVL